ncbi:MAG TPA: hypothetical protein VJ963_09760 [Bacteroidales bacterium]|nr:hypothetical protein [Bacteroidales bacterium]
MMKKILFPLLVLMIACTSTPPPPKKTVKKNTHSKAKARVNRTVVNPWSVGSYAAKPGEPEGRKYVSYESDGSYTDPTRTNDYLHAVIFVDKINAGIFLHEKKKSGPVEKFAGPVHISLTNSDGKELRMTSTRGWNKSGGILIERNNSDYSQFRIFLLQSNGPVKVELHDNDSTVYNFAIDASGFSSAFGQI